MNSGNLSQLYRPHNRYLPSKRGALQAHMHNVHNLGNSQTDTSYYTYYQNLIKHKMFTAKSVMLSGLYLASLTRKKRQ